VPELALPPLLALLELAQALLLPVLLPSLALLPF
jgi:hypothetical protein